jgi:8-oxo-dGTP pyrophosphatase MutT (NUDIX family)
MESSWFLRMLKPYLTSALKIEKGTLSAVLVIIHFRDGKPRIILTKRSNEMKNHAGQISCPGGTFSDSDKDLMQTAIRETLEEIGVMVHKEDVIGSLHSVHTLTSNFTIVPYVAVINSISKLNLNTKEIDTVLDLPLLDLLNTMTPDLENASFGELYKFEYDSNVVWGATARILKQMYDILHKCGMI